MYENMPYSNFHDLNTDWIVKKIKDVETSEANAKASEEAAAESATAAALSADQAHASELNAQQSAEASAVSAQNSEASANASLAYVEGTRAQVNLLQSRVDNIIPDGTQTEGNTELLDIRVGFNGDTYQSAGDEVRGSDNILNYNITSIMNSVFNGEFGRNYVFYTGGINQTGNSTSNQARGRTGFINLRDGIGYKLELDTNEYRIINIHLYQNSGDTASVRLISVKTLNDAIFTRNENENYLRVSFAHVDDSQQITASDLEAIRSSFVIKNVTDTTLTKKNVPADSYTVGQLFYKSIKILGIGNSYTRDSLRWVWKILKECGYDDVVVGHGYIGGITLAEQYESIIDTSSEYHSDYQYWKYTDAQTATKTNDQTLESIINDESWDVVIFQQQSDEAGQYSSFVSNDFDINDFVEYVKTNINNQNLRIGIALTWSHANGYSGDRFIEYYGGNPETQLNAIKTVIPQVANHMTQCDFIINSGLAIEYGRENTYLDALGDEMLRSDKNHLYYGIPSFMISLLYCITILDLDISTLTWYPKASDEGQTGITVSAYLAYLAKQSAIKAKQYF